MPKTKVEPAGTQQKEKPTIYLNNVKTAQVKGLEVGEKVQVLVEGKIIGVSMQDYGNSIDVEVSSMKVRSNENIFSDLAEDED